jgi:hypothetical protein
MPLLGASETDYFDQMFKSKEVGHPELNSKKVFYINLNEFICPKNETLCVSNIGFQPIYRDTHHLAMEFAKGLLPVVLRKLTDIPVVYEKFIKNTPLDLKYRR